MSLSIRKTPVKKVRRTGVVLFSFLFPLLLLVSGLTPKSMLRGKTFEELKENCTLSYTSINGVKGLKYRSKKKGYTDRWIFLPYTGFKSIKEWYFEDKCFYWTSTLYTRRPNSSMIGIMVPVYEDKMDRYEGLCIRPVTK